VSTFYLLPSRPVLGERFAAYLETLFPGLNWSSAAWPELADLLGDLAARRSDVYVVFGEDLSHGEDPARALADGFGAEPGDEIIEVGPGDRPGEMRTHRRQLGEDCLPRAA